MASKNIYDMFLGAKMLDFYIIICDQNPKVMIFYCDVIGMRSNLWSNCKCNRLLIVFVKCD